MKPSSKQRRKARHLTFAVFRSHVQERRGVYHINPPFLAAAHAMITARGTFYLIALRDVPADAEGPLFKAVAYVEADFDTHAIVKAAIVLGTHLINREIVAEVFVINQCLKKAWFEGKIADNERVADATNPKRKVYIPNLQQMGERTARLSRRMEAAAQHA